jgi:catechol 2,3-dioxygenase-like lactoylglutathione lyase family enzyme
MSIAHVTLPSRDVEGTASFFEKALGYRRRSAPGNSPPDVVWLELGGGQEIHVVFIDRFVVLPHESEFGRHVAVFYPLADFPALKERLKAGGAELIAPRRATPFERFFFREPVNGYVFEVIDATADQAKVS